MPFPELEMNQKSWNRLLLHAYWIIILCTVLLELLYLFFSTDMPTGTFVRMYIVRPTATLTVALLLAEAGVRYLRPKHHDYILISASAFLGVIVALIHSSLPYLLFLLFFPIMISIFYFQFKKLIFAFATTIVSLVLLKASSPAFGSTVGIIDLITIATVLAVYGGIAVGVLARGREVLRNLRASYESNQELLVRSIVMDKLAKTDTLTETYNHMAYHEFIDELVAHADEGRLRLHLAIMDIDNFKKVNDTYGHRAGDTVLREVASIAKAKAGANDIVARYGGEEFTLVFTDKSFADVYASVEDIRTTIGSIGHSALNGNTVTVSIGLHSYTPGMGKESLFVGADEALYEAKHSGKNRTILAENESKQQSSPA